MTQKYIPEQTVDIAGNAAKLIQQLQAGNDSRVDSNCQTLADVTWVDLDFYVEQAKRRKDKDSFDTALRVLTALKTQMLGKTK